VKAISLPAKVRNWLTAHFLADPMPEKLRIGDKDEPEPIVFVRYEEFAGFLISEGIDLLPNLDDWASSGWIADVRVDLKPTVNPTDAPCYAIARLDLPLGRHRLVGIRRNVLNAPTEAALLTSGTTQPKRSDTEGDQGRRGQAESVFIPETIRAIADTVLRQQAEEIYRTLAEVCRSLGSWQIWLIRWGRAIERAPTYDETTQTPSVSFMGMNQADAHCTTQRLGIEALYRHGCLPSSRQSRPLGGTLGLIPQTPGGTITQEKDKAFIAALRKALPALNALRDELHDLLQKLANTPLAVLRPLSRGHSGSFSIVESQFQGAVHQAELEHSEADRGGREQAVGEAAARYLRGEKHVETKTTGLSDRRNLILETMLDLGAIDRESRVSRLTIVRAINPKHTADRYKRDFDALADGGYTRGESGADGGTWLTDKGRKSAKSSGTKNQRNDE
jgi:hypothetical protein